MANNLYKIEPSFDSREYGFKQLSALFKAANLFDSHFENVSYADKVSDTEFTEFTEYTEFV